MATAALGLRYWGTFLTPSLVCLHSKDMLVEALFTVLWYSNVIGPVIYTADCLVSTFVLSHTLSVNCLYLPGHAVVAVGPPSF